MDSDIEAIERKLSEHCRVQMRFTVKDSHDSVFLRGVFHLHAWTASFAIGVSGENFPPLWLRRHTVFSQYPTFTIALFMPTGMNIGWTF